MANIAVVRESAILPFIEPKKSQLIAMVGEMQLQKEMSFAIQAVNGNSMLQQATPESIAKCVWNIGITGLTLNPIHQFAYITPRRVGDKIEAIITPSYKGLVKLITDTGSVKNIYAHPVYKGDDFDISLGTDTEIKHKPKFISIKPEDVTHVYAVAILRDGSKQVEIMPVAEVNEIRERSDSYKAWKDKKAKSSIWVDFYTEMCRKTVVKRLSKYLPKTESWEKVQQAIEIDNEDYEASNQQYSYIENLLETSAFDERQRAFIEREIEFGITNGRAKKLIEDLQLNQRDAISSGDNYSQGDISKKIANEI